MGRIYSGPNRSGISTALSWGFIGNCSASVYYVKDIVALGWSRSVQSISWSGAYNCHRMTVYLRSPGGAWYSLRYCCGGTVNVTPGKEVRQIMISA